MQFTDITTMVVELLQDARLNTDEDNFLWTYDDRGGNYCELNTGSWWREAEELVRYAVVGMFVYL